MAGFECPDSRYEEQPGEQSLNLLAFSQSGSGAGNKSDTAGQEKPNQNSPSEEKQETQEDSKAHAQPDTTGQPEETDQSGQTDQSGSPAQQNDAGEESRVEVPVIKTSVVSEHYDLQEKVSILQNVFGDKCSKIAELQNKFANEYLPDDDTRLNTIQRLCADGKYAESLGLKESDVDKYKKNLSDYVLPELKNAAAIQGKNGDYIALAKSLHQVEIVKSITGEPFGEKREELHFKAEEARIKGDLQALLRSDDSDVPSLVANLKALANLYRGYGDANKASTIRNFIDKLPGADTELSQEDTLKAKLDVCEFQFGKFSFENANQLTRLSAFYRKEKNDAQANYYINQASPIYDSVLKQYPSSIPKDFVPEYMSALNSYAQFLVAAEGTEEVTADDGKIHQINKEASAAQLKAAFLGQEIPSITAVEDAVAGASKQELPNKLADLADVYTLYGDDGDVQKTIALYEYAMQYELALQAQASDSQSLSQYLYQVLERRYKGYKATVLGDE